MRTQLNRPCIGSVLAVFVIAVLSACDDPGLLDLEPDPSASAPEMCTGGCTDPAKQGPGSLTVMTRNVYVGGNVDLVLAARPEDVPLVVAQVFQQMLSTNFSERAEAFAKEIASSKPHLVGLQEVSLIRRQSPGDLVMGGSAPAETVFLDQLEVLKSALLSRGLDYYVVGAVENIDVEVPMLAGVDPLSFDDVRLTDFDVLLARSDVSTANVTEVNYAAAIPVPGVGTIKRGYVAADASVFGRVFRIVTSHIEPVSMPEILPVHLGQITELAGVAHGHAIPVVVMGDLNTGPGRPGYETLTANGLVDVWNHNVRPAGEGYTCCFPDDLRGDSRTPDIRIDLILYRSANGQHGNHGLGSVVVELVGDEPQDITVSGLWPSDHVGVVGTIRAPASAWRL